MTKGTMSNVVHQASQLDTENILLGATQFWLSLSNSLGQLLCQMSHSQRVFQPIVCAIDVDVLGGGQLFDASQALERTRIQNGLHDAANVNARVNVIVGP